MPTYDYECQKCKDIFSLFQSIKADITSQCPKCKAIANRIISGGVRLIFKGSGFYCTDNKKPKRLKRRFGKDNERATVVPVADMSKIKTGVKDA